MSAGTCIPGTNIVRKEQRDMLNQLESLPIMKKWSKDLLSTELGWNDKGTFDWLLVERFQYLAGNMLYMWIFADNIEDNLGPLKFIIFYLLAGTDLNIFDLF